MSKTTCHQCGNDPGTGSKCQECGAIVYRFATDELSDISTASLSRAAYDTEDDSRRQLVSNRAPVRTPATPRTDPQQPQVASSESTDTFDPFHQVQQSNGSPALKVLIRMVIIGLVLAGLIGSQFGSWSEVQTAALLVVQPIGEVDLSTEVAEPVILGAWAELSRGDCVLWPEEGDNLFTPTVVGCDNLHDAEISAVTELTGTDWPFRDDTLDLREACKDSFAMYVDREFVSSKWRVGSVTPTEDEWAGGNHSYQCYVYLRGTQNAERAYQSGT